MLLLHQQHAGPEQIDKTVGLGFEAGQLFDRVLKGGHAYVGDAEDIEKINPELLAEVSRYGTATIKRAYGDWTTTNLRGWAPLGPVGSQMNKNNPSFDPRNYGFAQLSKLMRKQDYLEIKEVPMGDGSTNVHLYVRCKATAAAKA